MRIDEELSALIPPLTDDEYSRLEQSILEEGCRDALVLWGDIIIDGHNRYKICSEHNITFQTIQKEFSSRDEVKLWMLQNQLSRRNLSDFQRVEMVRKCEEAVKARAKQRQSEYYGNQYESGLPLKSAGVQNRDSRDELAQMAGVGHSTYEHAVKVIDNAPEPVIEATRRNQLSINSAYGVTKLSAEQQAEISERIEQGEPAQKVVSEVKRRGNTPEYASTSEQEILELDPLTPYAAPLRPYFSVLRKVDWGDSIKRTISRYSQIYRELIYHGNNYIWHPNSEEERSILKDFCSQYSQSGINITFEKVEDVAINNVEVYDIDTCRKFFEEYTQKKLREYYEKALKYEPRPTKPIIETKQPPREKKPVRIFGKFVNIFDTFEPRDKYNIIYLAPTWEGSQSIEELIKLPIQNIAYEDSAVLLWTECEKIPDALKVIQEWGFHYDTISFVWITPPVEDASRISRAGRMKLSGSKVCIVGTRGKVYRVNNQVEQVREAPIPELGVIPNEFRPLANFLFAGFPTIELFSRDLFSCKDDGLLYQWDAWKGEKNISDDSSRYDDASLE